MTVDLRALPDKVQLPTPPGKGRWSLVMLLITLLCSGLVVLFWPGDQSRNSAWFWCCAVVFPMLSGVLVFALRLLAYERQYNFAQGWNQSHGQQEHALIRQGQRAIAVLATSYCSPAGNNRLAQALRSGSTPLQPVYLPQRLTTLRLSRLPHPMQQTAGQSGVQRLQGVLQQVMRGLDEDLLRLKAPVLVRIRHNQLLTDAEVLAVWHSCASDDMAVEQVIFATQDDGLFWLDTWLDELGAPALLLSIEINLFAEPVAEQAESVSAVLLALAERCAGQGPEPSAWIHRPVSMSSQAGSVQDVLCWGRIENTTSEFFTWQLQVPDALLSEMNIVMSGTGYPLDSEKCNRLDDSFGLPASAVGNIAMIIASEQAVADSQPQLVMLQDATPHWCVVRPA
ncbi:hypothetical protein M2D63_020095 [Pseudomonas sp. BJa5]|uniref:hypothetical protein n=1 Tax=Pseudomonas sp. BJa5 TaxID=2936270 RepID=UPI002559BF51|nr:hypothetical protein [Pseudomonas sp. BGr12]MDL2423417.1 hypothetical protein [Pseudomonas sp. BGr12]